MTDDDDNKMTKEEWEICREAMIRASITVKMRKYDKYIEEEKRGELSEEGRRFLDDTRKRAAKREEEKKKKETERTDTGDKPRQEYTLLMMTPAIAVRSWMRRCRHLPTQSPGPSLTTTIVTTIEPPPPPLRAR